MSKKTKKGKTNPAAAITIFLICTVLTVVVLFATGVFKKKKEEEKIDCGALSGVLKPTFKQEPIQTANRVACYKSSQCTYTDKNATCSKDKNAKSTEPPTPVNCYTGNSGNCSTL